MIQVPPQMIRHEHLDGVIKYECSICRHFFPAPFAACPNCGVEPKSTLQVHDWLYELEDHNQHLSMDEDLY